MLSRLRVNAQVAFTKHELDDGSLSELLKSGIFVRGALPENGEEILLTIDGSPRFYNVIREKRHYICYENGYAGAGDFKVSLEDLRFFNLERKSFYHFVATEIDCSPRLREIFPGIWEIGTLRIPGKGKVLVVVAEQGSQSCKIPELVNYKSILILSLSEGEIPGDEKRDGKLIFHDRLVVDPQNNCFACKLADDRNELAIPAQPESYIDLDVTPPLLVIDSEEIPLPMDRGKPTFGARFLGYLFENPREAITCWDLERKIKPELQEQVAAPMGSDETLDEKAKHDIKKRIRKISTELTEARNDENASPAENKELEEELEILKCRLGVDTNIRGHSRLLNGSDKEKSRRRVRKALQIVIKAIGEKNEGIAIALKDSLGEGNEIYFSPPPDWGI